MPGASPPTRRVKILNAKGQPDVGDDGRFEIMIVTATGVHAAAVVIPVVEDHLEQVQAPRAGRQRRSHRR
jgi:hypothetical protein